MAVPTPRFTFHSVKIEFILWTEMMPLYIPQSMTMELNKIEIGQKIYEFLCFFVFLGKLEMEVGTTHLSFRLSITYPAYRTIIGEKRKGITCVEYEC